MIHQRLNKRGRRSLMIISLNAALLIGGALILPLITANAMPNTTTISVQDEHGTLSQAVISVFDANNGRQLANGLTDAATGLFTFRSSSNHELLVVARREIGTGPNKFAPGTTVDAQGFDRLTNGPTSIGPFGIARVAPGSFITIVAIQQAAAAQTSARFARPDSANGQNVCTPCVFGATQAMSGVRSFYIDETPAVVGAVSFAGSSNTSDSSKRMIAVVAWDTLGQVASGHPNNKGRFDFEVPEGIASDAFLIVRWTEDGEISLVAAAGAALGLGGQLGFNIPE